TGYKGKAPFESWLITPPLNVAGASSKILSFETLVNGYGSISTTFEVYVLSSNDPKTATKTKLNATLATPPATGYSVATSSGNIDLSSYGKQVFIGFCYKATDDKTAAWGVDNVKFGL
ncbi:MAG: choice-of-anchor J domain-containing protein, partial [Muribaculaceae bacterium]